MGDDARVRDEIVLGRVREICGRFAGVDEGRLQDRPLFRVGRRRFAIFNGVTSPSRSRWDGSGRSLHFQADPTELEALRHDVRFVESPHHGVRGWLALRIDDPDAVDWVEIAELLDSAHRLIKPIRNGTSEAATCVRTLVVGSEAPCDPEPRFVWDHHGSVGEL